MSVIRRNVELRTCNNDKAWLSHWDSIHGNDVIIMIKADGTATVSDENGERDCHLATELIKLANLLND